MKGWLTGGLLGLALVAGGVALMRPADALEAEVLTEATPATAAGPAPSPVLLSPDAASIPELTEEAVVKPLVEYPEVDLSLDEVEWTVPKTMAVADLASQWGMPAKRLRRLNPSLRGKTRANGGDRLTVFAHDDETPPQSVGAPNRGKLVNGIPLPEGDAWRLRQRRARVYGSTTMVQSMLKAFEAYGAAYPDGPEIRLGDLSHRKGGRLSPHVSHRTGRDVDIGYILYPDKRGERYWQNAKEDSFDAEKNWYLIKALVETGRVQQIFMSARLQKLVMPLAEKELSEAEMARYFRRANPDPRSPSVIKHWKGHLDHMHVRFTCEPENRRCISRSR